MIPPFFLPFIINKKAFLYYFIIFLLLFIALLLYRRTFRTRTRLVGVQTLLNRQKFSQTHQEKQRFATIQSTHCIELLL